MTTATITSYGAAREVTGSRHLFQCGDARLLLDCGLFQGKRKESYDKNRHFGFDPHAINAVVLSHAHLDHCGALPRLLVEGFTGTIYATHATAEIAQMVLMDSAYLQVRDVEFVNKLHRRRGIPEQRPLYTPDDVPPVVAHIVAHDYNKPFEPTPDTRVTFLDAGHILGSAQTMLEWGGGDYPQRFVFTGDLGRINLPLLNDPAVPPSTDALMMEATYGGRLHDPIETAREELALEVEHIVANNGCMLVPAFSIERTQEVLYELAALEQAGRIPKLPVFVDSPLAQQVTQAFEHHLDLLDDEFQRLRRFRDPFGPQDVTFTKSVEESKALNERKGPLIILAGSGMCEGGRIVHHLRNRIMRPETTILIVGYMAENTLGRRLADREPEVTIFGERLPRRARVKILNSFSGHAGQDELLKYVERMDGRLRKVLLVHGELSQQEALRDEIKRRHNTLDVIINAPGEAVLLA